MTEKAENYFFSLGAPGISGGSGRNELVSGSGSSPG